MLSLPHVPGSQLISTVEADMIPHLKRLSLRTILTEVEALDALDNLLAFRSVSWHGWSHNHINELDNPQRRWTDTAMLFSEQHFVFTELHMVMSPWHKDGYMFKK
jgi:hypothetical protein